MEVWGVATRPYNCPAQPAHRSLPPGWLDGTVLACTLSPLSRWVTAGVQGDWRKQWKGLGANAHVPLSPVTRRTSSTSTPSRLTNLQGDACFPSRLLLRLPDWSQHDADSPAVAKASWAPRLWFSCTALAGISVPEPGHDRPAIHTASYPPAKLACILAHLTHKTRLRRVRLMVASMVS